MNAAGFTIRSWIKWYDTYGTHCANKFNGCSRHIVYGVKSGLAFVFDRAAVSRPSARQTTNGDSSASAHGKLMLNTVHTTQHRTTNATADADAMGRCGAS